MSDTPTTTKEDGAPVSELTTRQRIERLEERVEILVGSAVTLDAKIHALSTRIDALEHLSLRLDAEVKGAMKELERVAAGLSDIVSGVAWAVRVETKGDPRDQAKPAKRVRR